MNMERTEMKFKASNIGRRFFINYNKNICEAEIINFCYEKMYDKEKSRYITKAICKTKTATEDGIKELYWNCVNFYYTEDDAIRENDRFEHWDDYTSGYYEFIKSKGFEFTSNDHMYVYIINNGNVIRVEPTNFIIPMNGEPVLTFSHYTPDRWFYNKETANIEANKMKKVFRLP